MLPRTCGGTFPKNLIAYNLRYGLYWLFRNLSDTCSTFLDVGQLILVCPMIGANSTIWHLICFPFLDHSSLECASPSFFARALSSSPPPLRLHECPAFRFPL